MLPLLTLLVVTATGVAACSGDDASEEAAPSLDAHCAQGPDQVTRSPRSNVQRVDGVLYAEGSRGIDRLDGAEPTRVYDAGEDLGLELLAVYDGDLVVHANAARTTPAPHLFRVTTDGEVVWDVPATSAGLQDLDPVVLAGDTPIDLATGKETDWESPITIEEYVLEHEGLDYSLVDRSATAWLYLDIRGGGAVTGPDREVIETFSGSAALCGDRVYRLSPDGATLTTYRVGRERMDEVAEVRLPEPATQTAVRTTDGAVVLKARDGAMVVTD